MPKQSYQKLILQISVLLLPEEDCSIVLHLPSLTKSYKSYKEKRKSPGRSVVSRQYHSFSSYSFLPFLFISSYSVSPLILFLLLFVFSSYSFSPLIRFLLLFVFSSYSFSPLIRLRLLFFFSLFFSSLLTSLLLIVLNMFLLSSFKL